MENNQQDRDEVLIAFHKECDIPTRADVERWAERFPRFANDIRDHAAIRIAMLADADEEPAELGEVMIARSRSRMQAAIYAAEEAARSGSKAGATFSQLITGAGLTQAELARRLPIKRAIVADLVAGRMLDPRPRFTTSVTRELGISLEQFNVAYASAIRSPSLGGRAKSQGQPAANQRHYDDIIRTSGMEDDQIAYWLEQS